MPTFSTTSLTGRFDPATNVDLWTLLTRGAHPSNGGDVRLMDDADGRDLTFVSNNDAQRPTYAIPGINGLGALDFASGLHNKLTDLAAAVNKASSTLLSVSAYTYYVAMKTGTADANATPYDNAGPLTDELAYWGLAPSLNGGTLHLVAWHFDGGGLKQVSANITANANIVARVIYDGTNLRLSVDGGGSEASVAAGNVANLSNQPLAGRNWNNTVSYAGLLGETLFYTIAQSGSDLANTTQYMIDKWTVAGAAATFPALSVAI